MELKIKDLYKSYDHGKTYAINDVSADFTPGIYGILGPNGAGKSTMFGMLTDNLRPDIFRLYIQMKISLLMIFQNNLRKTFHMPEKFLQ